MVKKMYSLQASRKYILYLFCLLLGASFFSFEFFPNFSEDYYSALNEYRSVEKANKLALGLVKKNAMGTPAGDSYEETRALSLEKWNQFETIRNNEKVFGFKSMHFFMERFGLFLGIFMYALYNLLVSFYYERKNLGSKIIHGFILFVCMFYFFWIFQQFQDFSKFTYYIMTFISAAVVVIAVSLISKHQRRYINKLKETISRLVAFSFLHTKQEKKQEMLQMFRDLSKED